MSHFFLLPCYARHTPQQGEVAPPAALSATPNPSGPCGAHTAVLWCFWLCLDVCPQDIASLDARHHRVWPWVGALRGHLPGLGELMLTGLTPTGQWQRVTKKLSLSFLLQQPRDKGTENRAWPWHSRHPCPMVPHHKPNPVGIAIPRSPFGDTPGTTTPPLSPAPPAVFAAPAGSPCPGGHGGHPNHDQCTSGALTGARASPAWLLPP